MSEAELLSQVRMISEKYDTLCRKTGGYFNIFEIISLEHDEVIICRVLQDLLSPCGTHHQGSVYLRLFFESVLQLPITQAELDTARVCREYRIDSQRRIDLVIEAGQYFIPIEVKIYAGDQPRQCFDYYNEAKRHTSSPYIYYLTRFGTPPGKDSAEGLTPRDGSYQEVRLLSFSEDILTWLELCLKESCTIRIAPIREIILQLMSVIRKFTGKLEDEQEMELKGLIMSSADNLKSAIAIQSAVNTAREELLIRLFKAIEDKVGRPKLENGYDYADQNYHKSRGYYERKNSTYPGISYACMDTSQTKCDKAVWVRIELEDTFYVGYCCPVNGAWSRETLSTQKIESLLHVSPKPSTWWAYTEAVPDGTGSESPDFKNHNDAYYRLLEPQNLDQFAQICADRILALLK